MGKPPLIGKKLDDEFHEWSISILQVFEWKDPTDLPLITSLDVRLIILSAHMLPLIPLFTHIRDPCCYCNDFRCQGERDTT